MAFTFYSDMAMTTPAGEQVFYQDDSGAAAADRVVYLGAPSAESHASVVVSVIAGPGGLPSGTVSLALSAAGLDSAVPGAALSFDIDGGVANVQALHIRVINASGSSGIYTNLSLSAEITEST